MCIIMLVICRILPCSNGCGWKWKIHRLRLIQQLLGGSFLSQYYGESVSAELVRSTLPVYWDDPAHPNTLKKVLVSTFQGGGKQTKASENELPLTTFLLTVNFRLDDDIRLVKICTGRL